jgi:hypothetical protein
MQGKMWWGARLALCGGLALAGCVTMGRPIDRLVARSDIPLVPVPPPPVTARSAAADTAPRPAPRNDLPPVPLNKTPIPLATTPRQLVQNAQARYAGIDCYIVRLTRREMLNKEMKPEERILFKFRKKPWSVYFKWLEKEGKGREAVYVKGRYGDKIHTRLAAGDVLLFPAGSRIALAPDNPLVLRQTRHPITEAGIGASIARLGEILAATERGDRKMGTLTLLNPTSRPEFEQPVPALEHAIPVKYDSSLPRGGKRTFYFEPASGLPTLIRTQDERGQEVEYYRYDYFQPCVKLDEADFDPDQLWGKPRTATGR